MTSSLCIVLHSHLPAVLGHGRWPHGVDWLNEAVVETYLPLLAAFEDLVAEGIAPRVTVGVTPILAEQLRDPRYPDELATYLTTKRDAARADAAQFRAEGETRRAALARWWASRYAAAEHAYTERYGRDIVGAWAALQDRRALEVITSAATHGYLPLLGTAEAVDAQVALGVATYTHHFGHAPAGIWLPECAYRPRAQGRPGVEEVLAAHGIDYFFVDAHLVRGGEPVGTYRRWPVPASTTHGPRATVFPVRDVSLFSPYWVRSPDAPLPHPSVAVLARDPAAARQVWSADGGYPGDPAYLEFHKKHWPGGLRYWAVTGRHLDLGDKQPYEPRPARARVREHARHFVGTVRAALRAHRAETDRPGILLAPFDAELFGHWWFEGPLWLTEVVRLLARDREVTMRTVSDALRADPPEVVLTLPEGSWGEGGHHGVWMNEHTRWTWDRVRAAERAVSHWSAEALARGDAVLTRIVTQAARELLLLESSDWQFLITMGHARDYAESRVRTHADACDALLAMAPRSGALDEADLSLLATCEERDRAFAQVDLHWWAGLPATVR